MPMGALGMPINDRDTVHLPIEIIDEILDYLFDDESSLRSCALVSKSWTPGCRKHIFSRLNFETPLDFVKWSESISAAPNGPHPYTRELTFPNHYLEDRYWPSKYPTVFLEHFRLFCNVRDLVIECSGSQQTIDNIPMFHVFGHLFDTLQSLSIHRAFCSPQALISLIASFQQLECLNLGKIQFKASEVPCPLPEKHTFKGELLLMERRDSSEEFVGMLAQYDLQYRNILVNGERWLQDTTWNRCLAKFSDNLDIFCMYWTKSDGFQTTRFKMPTFNNLRELGIWSSSKHTTILPPPEFLSSITSTHLSFIIIDITAEESDKALDAIKDYDEALCQLANQLDPSSSGAEKLLLKLLVAEESPDPAAVLPRFSELGRLVIEVPNGDVS